MLDDLLSFDSFLELNDQLFLSFLGNQWIGQDSLDLVLRDGDPNLGIDYLLVAGDDDRLSVSSQQFESLSRHSLPSSYHSGTVRAFIFNISYSFYSSHGLCNGYWSFNSYGHSAHIWLLSLGLDPVSDGRSNYIDSETLKVLALFSLVI